MPKPNEHSDKVEFRWRQHETQWRDRLAVAAQQAGRSVGDHARVLLKASMMTQEELSHELHMLREEVSAMSRQLNALPTIVESQKAADENVYELRDALLAITVKLLTDVAQLPPERALEWVRTHLDAE
jgi:hypothetical protein